MTGTSGAEIRQTVLIDDQPGAPAGAAAQQILNRPAIVVPEPGCCHRPGRIWWAEAPNAEQQPEITMRPAAYYYLTQVWPSREGRQTQRGALFRVKSRGRHARAPHRDRIWRELPAVTRRVLAVLGGTSQAA